MPILHYDDVDLYYESSGEGPSLLLIHGLGSSTRDWQRQVPVFSGQYRVVTFDVRGHGRSSKPPGPYSIPLFAEDTARLMRALDLGPTHVVGISMGGMIAFQLAASYPELLRSLVIVNSAPAFVVSTFKERLQVWQRVLIVRLLGMRRMGQVLAGRLFPSPEHEEERRLFVERWAENDPLAYRAAMQAIVGWSVADQIANIHCPTLVVASDQDYTPVATKEAYIARMPAARLAVIENAHHAVPVERPQAFNAVLADFLAEQSCSEDGK